MEDNSAADGSVNEVENLQDFMENDEKQISVDPISLQDSNTKKLHNLYSSKNKFFSYSLPNSATSSPKMSLNILKKKPRNLTQASSLPIHPSFYRQNSIALSNLEQLRVTRLQRSKSCGEGRASAASGDLPFWSRINDKLINNHEIPLKNITSFGDREFEGIKVAKETTEEEECEEDFKCGALCLFLPGFGKAKPVKTKMDQDQPDIAISEESRSQHVVSKRVSLEKFECGSWRSSAIMDEHEEDIKDATNLLYYDLPLEMIRFSVSDTHSPVTTAFVFDKDPKGVLKKCSSRNITHKKSPDSSRHVRFSTSSSPESNLASPTNSVTSRILKAREELNVFLDAQIS